MGIKEFLKKKLIKTKKEQISIPCLEGHFLDGRKAFITGGSSGIGYAIAKSFLFNGASVVLGGRNEEKFTMFQLQARKKLSSSLQERNKNRI